MTTKQPPSWALDDDGFTICPCQRLPGEDHLVGCGLAEALEELETLRGIALDISAEEILGNDGPQGRECMLCGEPEGLPHDDLCPWLRASEVVNKGDD